MPIVFSDIDGTLVHYVSHLPDGSVQTENTPVYTSAASSPPKKIPLARLPPSSTGKVGMVPAELNGAVAAMREETDVKFVIVSGARWKTVRNRADSLPPADAYVAEGGGRIFYRNGDGSWREDAEWRRTHGEGAGEGGADADLPLRQPLRQLAEQLRGLGATVDDKGYETMFRIPASSPAIEWPTLPDGVSRTTNLGHTDVCLSTAGKGNATRFIIERLGGSRESSCCLCDDDNDIVMMREVDTAFVVQATSESVARLCEAAAAAPDGVADGVRAVLMSEGGPAGTLEAVSRARAWVANSASSHVAAAV